jgi:hypothetical protein
MSAFTPGQTIVTKEPVIAVDAGLGPGFLRFQLVVVNERGVASLPAVLTVEIPKPTRGVRQPRRRQPAPGG